MSAGCAAVSARQPPGRTTIFFPIWGALLLLFLNVGDFLVIFYGGLFHCLEAFLLHFHNLGFFLLCFSIDVGSFSLSEGHYDLYGCFLGLPPSIQSFGGCPCHYVSYIPYPLASLSAAFVYRAKPTATSVFNSQ